VTTVLWQEHVQEIRAAVRLAVQEPITQSDHVKVLQANRDEWVEVEELAAFAANREGAWSDEDYETDDESSRYLTDEAWDRACDAKERELRAMVAKGKLEGRGRGKTLKVRMGSFDDAFGRESSTAPEDWLFYRVVPDAQPDDAATEQALLQRVSRVLGWMPADGEPRPDLVGFPARLAERLKQRIAYELIEAWVELLCVEAGLGQIADSLGTHDALVPGSRELLEETKAQLLESQEQLRALHREVVMRDPLEEELAEMRQFLLRNVY
jgi:hypothetical protein